MIFQAWHLPSLRLTVAVSVALSVGLCFNRLLGLHGLEASLVCALVLGPFVALTSARATLWLRQQHEQTSVAEVFSLSQQIALLVSLIPVTLLALNAIRITQCTPGIGLTYMVLGLGVSMMLCGLIGTLCALLLPFGVFASAIALLIPLGLDALGLFRLWDTPAIFSYSHTVGYAPGTIYDEGLKIPVSYWSFRALSALWFLGLACLGFGVVDRQTLRPSWRLALERPGLPLLGLLCIGAGLVAEAYGPELGHRTTVAHMTAAITNGSPHQSERCELIVPSELPPNRLRLMAAECDLQVERLERALGVEHPRRIRVFMFRNAAEKQALMGAGRTYIAKPWRDEVYLQLAAWPHPVLAHELAHIVAGATSDNFLEIPLGSAGVVPNPGLIEGIAVATAWDLRQELTPHQWSRAMLDLEQLPSLDQLMSLGFGTLPARRAYSASGSFIRWLLDTRGVESVQTAYRDGTLHALGSTSDLEAAWHGFLRQSVPLEEDEISRVALAMHRRSIFSAVCPHHVADLRTTLAHQTAARDNEGAVETSEAVLNVDPTDLYARTEFVGALARNGQLERARQQRDALRDAYEAPSNAVDLATEQIADADWRQGREALALTSYQELLRTAPHNAARRRLAIKAIGLESTTAARDAIFQLLVGPSEYAISSSVAVAQGAALAQSLDDGLGDYLVGRRLVAEQRFDLARPLLERALERSLPTPIIRREAERLLGQALTAEGQWSDAEAVWTSLRDASREDTAAHDEAALWLTRVASIRSAQH